MKVAALAAVLVLVACSSGVRADELACETVSTEFVHELDDALTTQGGGSLRGVRAVRSPDHEKLWYITGDIEAAGLEGTDNVALWATNIEPSSTTIAGLVYAVDERAAEFSEWPRHDGTATADTAAKRAISCTAEALK